MSKLLLLSPALAIVALVSQQPASTPVQAGIPADAAQMTNPVKPTPEGLAHAKKQYAMDCAMCHGANGDGKGDLVADMKLTLKDFTDPLALKDMPDGQLFYLIKDGKGQMPGEGDRVKKDDVWNMVILVRSFSKK